MHYKRKLSNFPINSRFEDQAPFCNLNSQRKYTIASGEKVILSVFKALQEKRSMEMTIERLVTKKEMRISYEKVTKLACYHHCPGRGTCNSI